MRKLTWRIVGRKNGSVTATKCHTNSPFSTERFGIGIIRNIITFIIKWHSKLPCLSHANLNFTHRATRKRNDENKMRIYFAANCKLELCQQARALALAFGHKLNERREKDVTQQYMPIGERRNCARINMGPTYFVNNFVCYPRARSLGREPSFSLKQHRVCQSVAVLTFRVMHNDVSCTRQTAIIQVRANRAFAF